VIVISMHATGLRERKKIKTRESIQSHALRLFRAQGYDKTTTDQIAEAAEISPSTFFRYFPTKEAVVLDDGYDELLSEAIRRQPSDVSVFEAVRRGMHELQEGDTKRAQVARERNRLILSVPDLRAAWLDQSFSSFTERIAETIAVRVGRDAEDFEVRMLAGALHGVWLSAMFTWIKHPRQDFNELVNSGTALLETGFFRGGTTSSGRKAKTARTR
jgi:AcrR family transcriptional regulator